MIHAQRMERQPDACGLEEPSTRAAALDSTTDAKNGNGGKVNSFFNQVSPTGC